MKIYTLKALTKTDATEVRDLRSFDSLDEAKVRFHTDIGNAISAEDTQKVLCMIINEDGGIHASETWAS